MGACGRGGAGLCAPPQAQQPHMASCGAHTPCSPPPPLCSPGCGGWPAWLAASGAPRFPPRPRTAPRSVAAGRRGWEVHVRVCACLCVCVCVRVCGGGTAAPHPLPTAPHLRRTRQPSPPAPHHQHPPHPHPPTLKEGRGKRHSSVESAWRRESAISLSCSSLTKSTWMAVRGKPSITACAARGVGQGRGRGRGGGGVGGQAGRRTAAVRAAASTDPPPTPSAHPAPRRRSRLDSAQRPAESRAPAGERGG